MLETYKGYTIRSSSTAAPYEVVKNGEVQCYVDTPQEARTEIDEMEQIHEYRVEILGTDDRKRTTLVKAKNMREAEKSCGLRPFERILQITRWR